MKENQSNQAQNNLEKDKICVKTGECYPVEGKKVFFLAGMVIARDIIKCKHPVKGSSSHRTQIAKISDGQVYIEKDWVKK